MALFKKPVGIQTPLEEAHALSSNALNMFSSAREDILAASKILTDHAQGNRDMIELLHGEAQEAETKAEEHRRVANELARFVPGAVPDPPVAKAKK